MEMHGIRDYLLFCLIISKRPWRNWLQHIWSSIQWPTNTSSTTCNIFMWAFSWQNKKIKNHWNYQCICDIWIIWKLSWYFEHWTILIVLFFVVLILSLMFTIKPTNLEKYFSRFSKNMIKPPLIWLCVWLFKFSNFPIMLRLMRSNGFSPLLNILHKNL